jgi:ribosomal protein S18 acetylase RimI-like enzyme
VDGALEADGRDGSADHAVVCAADGSVAATGRLLDPGPPGAVGAVGRVATRPRLRGRGFGLAVMGALERRSIERGLEAIELHAQVSAVGFYERQGYVGIGERYLEAGIEHLTMRKELIPGLRPVRDTDGPALERLIGTIWSEYPGCVLEVDREEPWLRAPAAAYAGWGATLWVVPAPTSRVGSVAPGAEIWACCGLRPHGPGSAELKSLYVAATARRRGWGAALVRRTEREARAGGTARVEMWSDTRFADAHRLYERLGYLRTGRTRELRDLSETVEYEFVRDLPISP